MLSRIWKQRFVRKAVYATVTLAVLSSMLCWYFGISSTRDLKAYAGMALECHPVWRDLALHRIREGQSVDDVIAKTKPVYVVRHGRFDELGYQEPLSFTVVQLIAIDGRLARACTGSCTWDYTFFDSMTDAQTQEMSDSFDNHERTLVYNGHAVVRPPADEERGKP